MTEAANKETYLKDVELVESLIKNYRDNNPPLIKAGEFKQTNMAFIYVLIMLIALAFGFLFLLLGSLLEYL